ncbi:unnamed protein product [Caenorhabditis angaria]|uniref:Programmed cell death protein 10 dimerisation domain-containing protein n=1 Tax=Caenorhabditis angaria TaxID=860376 RepID=A0A9P1MXU0_9PELO|nr:unnamed protein product [Caenorhabditis angaria]
MNEEGGYLGAMTYQCLYSPVLEKLKSGHRDDPRAHAALNKLHNALTTCEQASPSFLYDLTKILLNDSELNVNLQESYLRMHDTSPTNDLIVSGFEHIEEYQELTRRAIELRRVLSRVPEEMSDRHAFLETIKLIASSIKKLLEAINAVYKIVPPNAQPAVEKRKREFVHYSKRFSNTLKTYFKDQNANEVSVSANQLVFQTTMINFSDDVYALDSSDDFYYSQYWLNCALLLVNSTKKLGKYSIFPCK